MSLRTDRKWLNHQKRENSTTQEEKEGPPLEFTSRYVTSNVISSRVHTLLLLHAVAALGPRERQRPSSSPDQRVAQLALLMLLQCETHECIGDTG